MNLVKVYDSKGKHVDSFQKDISKYSGINHAHRIAQLNENGYYVRRQFSKSGKTLVRSYAK
jgi:hypothetical protein